jgi:hypothetical protein
MLRIAITRYNPERYKRDLKDLRQFKVQIKDWSKIDKQ